MTELHDTHATPADEPDHMAAARGELRAAQALASHLMDGAQLLGEERQQIANALRTALNLTDMRIVPADAIVLEQPTDDQIEDLGAAWHGVFDDTLSEMIAATESEDGRHAVTIHSAGCPNCGVIVSGDFTPTQARTLAACIVETADAAEAGAL